MLADKLKSLPHNHPHARMLSGKTPFFASTLDQRFSFGLTVPRRHRFDGPELDLLVIIHGTNRNPGGYLSKLKSFSDEHNCVILAPLFPAGIEDPDDLNNYKEILYRDIRFDTILLSMIDQASKIWRVKTAKFFLHGFSGGGQFVHRFLLLHPERLAGVSVGAPGRFTSPVHQEPWPAGVSNVADVFGIKGTPDFTRISRVPVQFVVGEEDTQTGLLDTMKPTTAEKEAGRTRVERIKWLRDAFEKRGVKSDLAIVPGVGHDGLKMLPAVEEWMVKHLKAK